MTLNIQIDSQGRQFLIDNNETIVLVFPPDEGYDYSLACISFSPFGDNNSIEFKEVWNEYASSQSIQFNKVIEMGIKQRVYQGNVYTFNGVGIVNGGTAYSKEVYGLSNQGTSNSSLTCGLGQLIVVNNNEDICPLNVISIPYNQTTYFKPTTKVWIFIASGIEGSMIISTKMLKPINVNSSDNQNFIDRTITTGYYLEIDLKETQTVIFDSSINGFKYN